MKSASFNRGLFSRESLHIILFSQKIIFGPCYFNTFFAISTYNIKSTEINSVKNISKLIQTKQFFCENIVMEIKKIFLHDWGTLWLFCFATSAGLRKLSFDLNSIPFHVNVNLFQFYRHHAWHRVKAHQLYKTVFNRINATLVWLHLFGHYESTRLHVLTAKNILKTSIKLWMIDQQ